MFALTQLSVALDPTKITFKTCGDAGDWKLNAPAT
jgi:hypothetical protein